VAVPGFVAHFYTSVLVQCPLLYKLFPSRLCQTHHASPLLLVFIYEHRRNYLEHMNSIPTILSIPNNAFRLSSRLAFNLRKYSVEDEKEVVRWKTRRSNKTPSARIRGCGCFGGWSVSESLRILYTIFLRKV